MRCACGYDEAWHQDGRCPLCACGKLPGEHLAMADPPSPLLCEHDFVQMCPGKPRTAAGKLPRLRQGKLRAPAPPEVYRLHASGAYVPVVEPEAAPEPLAVEPRVPLRDTYALDEISKQAMTLGKLAAAAGWAVDPLYGVTGAGVEVSALRMRRGDLRALASWERAPGGSWRTAGGWGWLQGGRPVALGVKELTVRIKGA